MDDFSSIFDIVEERISQLDNWSEEHFETKAMKYR